MKLRETIKAIVTASFLAALTIFALSTNAFAEGQTMTHKQAKAYESEMIILNGKIVPKTDEELRLCKHYSEKGKAYKEYNKGRTDKMFTATVRNCERRVRMYCGYLQEVKILENQD